MTGRLSNGLRRRAVLLPLAVVLAAALALTLVVTRGDRLPARQPADRPDTTGAQPAPGDRVVGFYSAGLRASDCYGTCARDTEGWRDQEHTRQRLRELQALGISFVVNGETVAGDYARAPEGFLTFLDEARQHGIAVAYSLASGPRLWFPSGRFTTSEADEVFRRTDLDGDGVSDLDGALGALYQGHEVLEWATHDQRVEIYRVAKRWFPTTPVLVYYAAMTQPFAEGAERIPHPDGPGGVWADYAYGPGEADIALVGVRRNGALTAADAASTRDRAVDADALAAAAREVVALVHERTPDVEVWLSTSFAGDDVQRSRPDAMWTPAEIDQWFAGLASVPGVRGLFLRSFGRFRYDLAHPAFHEQRAAFAAAARRVGGPA
jgi:hypothetical protein